MFLKGEKCLQSLSFMEQKNVSHVEAENDYYYNQ